MKINIKKTIVIGVIIGIVSMVYSWLTCGWLFSGIYRIEPTNIWKFSADTALPVGQMIFMFLANILLGVILAGVYAYIKGGIPGSGIKKGLCFGLIVWLVGTLPGLFATYMFITIAGAVIWYWLVMGLIKYLILGVIIAKMIKE